MKYVGAAAVDTMAAMEKRGLYPALGAFRGVEGIMRGPLWEIVGYMDWIKIALSGLKKVTKDVKKAHMWSWHILHRDAVANGVVDISIGVLPLNNHLHACYSTYLAEISVSFRFVEIMHHAHPCVTILICSYTWYYINGQKAMCNCVPPKGSLWQLACYEEKPWPPWSAVIKAPLWKEAKYEGLRAFLQRPVAKPFFENTDTGLVSIQRATFTQVETHSGKLIAEASRVEVMAMHCGCPVPSIISSLPFAACIIEVPRLYTSGLHNLVAQLLLYLSSFVVRLLM